MLSTFRLPLLAALPSFGLGASLIAANPEDGEERLARTPIEVATQLGEHYGHQLKSVSYIPALALVGRYRLAALTEDPAMAVDVERIAGNAPPAKQLRGSIVAGHLIYAELNLQERVLAAARDVPDHNQMSDGVFMGCPLLAAAGRYGACLEHLRAVQSLCLREDGIYRHSPLDEAAWGRGNGFPALGLAWALDYIPESFGGRSEILTSLQTHLAALDPYQNANGMWHQVIDHPESYVEFSCTCMITYAMLHGLRQGWLERATYEPVVDRAWEAIKLRIAMDGEHLEGVCEGTGKQKSLEAYFKRKAIHGRDDRGGAMALMVSTERALWERQRG